MKDFPQGFSTMTSSIEYANNYNKWILKKVSKYIGYNLLEVGIGQGNLKQLFNNSYNKYYSIDIDSTVIERAKNRDPTGQYFQMDVTDKIGIQNLTKLNIDTVVCFNVLEHIKNHKLALENMSRIIKTGHNIIISVPAHNILFNDMDRLAGHYRRYSIKGVIQLTRDLPVIIKMLEYFNPIGALGWYLNKHIKHQNLDSKSLNKQVLIFDKYFVPISKLINRLTRQHFGQSIICVLEKT